jgi:hypothetical protein
MRPKDAKKDVRLKNSGKLISFDCFGRIFSLVPTTFFYNWLYINTLNEYKDLSAEVLKYNTFTDIEFNQNKSINCQARAAAIFVSLKNEGLLEKALKSKEDFLNIIYEYYKHQNFEPKQLNIWEL